MRIDSHQHYWKPERGDYDWMSPADTVLYRNYLPADLRPSLERHNIRKTIVVQAAPTTAETDFLLQLAATEDSIAGVVGWLDMEDGRFPETLDQYRKKPKFVSIRPMLQDLPDDRWILRPRVLSALRTLAERDVAFDFLTHPRHLPFVLDALEAAPGLRAVIDHISKPAIGTGKLDPWRGWIAEVAQHPNVHCKLSGMITEADHKSWSVDDLRPYVEHITQCFGFDRLMFGSDWPVCLLAGTYDQVIGAVEQILAPQLTEERERMLFGENAMRFYKVKTEAAAAK
jgi:L-fuconolactonase